ncbi:hypothetical protein Javan436_0005 [Streptococcus phage Javan436]|nr:hypothetical protein Javan436_0005 [Streptococcus phage Javan436]
MIISTIAGINAEMMIALDSLLQGFLCRLDFFVRFILRLSMSFLLVLFS